jgi:hypothetical protein
LEEEDGRCASNSVLFDLAEQIVAVAEAHKDADRVAVQTKRSQHFSER